MISTLVLVGLVLVWAVVLLPDLFARISRGRKGDTIRSFNTQLSSLGRSAPVHRDSPSRPVRDSSARGNVAPLSNVIDLRSRRGSGVAGPPRASTPSGTSTTVGGVRQVSASTRKRRQDVLVSLGAAALLTLLATVAFGGVFLYVHLMADLLMAAYLVALQRLGAARAPQRPHAHVSPGLTANLTPLDLHRGPAPAPARALQPRRIAN